MPHVREIIPVVVLNHSITSASSGIASIHRHDCKDIEREQRKHGSAIYGPYDSVDLALKDYIDSEMEEMGYSDDDVKVHPCCRQSSANEGGKIMATTTTQKTRKARSSRKATTPVVKQSRSQLDAKSEKAMDAKLSGLVFKSEKVAVAARRYAVKLVKKQLGLRTSIPPHTGLTEAQAESVRKALAPKVKAPAKTAAEPIDGNGRS
jgi:hypothetical protein